MKLVITGKLLRSSPPTIGGEREFMKNMDWKKDYDKAFPGEIYLLPSGMVRVEGVDKDADCYAGMAVNPYDVKELINRAIFRHDKELIKKIEKKKLNYPYQNSKTEWADGQDAGLQTAILIVKEALK